MRAVTAARRAASVALRPVYCHTSALHFLPLGTHLGHPDKRRTRLAAELLASLAQPGSNARARDFVEQGAGCRAGERALGGEDSPAALLSDGSPPAPTPHA
jgi:hypothetical protein